MITLRRVVVAFMLIAWPVPQSPRTVRDEAAAIGPTVRNKASKADRNTSRAARACCAAAGRCGHRAQHRHAERQARLYGDRRNVLAVRSIGRSLGGGVLYRLCAKDDNHAARPLTFVFNGGPGAASAFLHLGVVGPRIAQFGMTGHDGADVRLVDNPDTWLAFTDLVLIDPVGTGWSRPAKPDGGSAFWGVRSDAEFDGQGRSRFTSPRTAASARRNSSWAKAMAAFAPPRSRAPCRASRAS